MATATLDIHTVAGIVVIAAGVFAVEEVLRFVIIRVARRAGADGTVARDVGYSMRLVAVALVLSNVLSYSGLSSLFTGLTVSAVVAVAISLALQTTLTNVISGILLFSDGTLRLGDTVEFSGIKGKVVRIGLRNTWVKTEHGHLAVIGNANLSSGPLTNHSATERLSKRYAFDDG